MGKSIAFVHHKGGTGKTTSCINIAGWLAEAGKKVLIVDLDPQGNVTVGLRVDKNSLKNSMYNVMVAGSPMNNVIVPTDFDNLYLAPSSYDLAWAELDGKTMSLFSQSLNEVKNHFDYVLIDTPPSLGRLMVSGVVAADYVITTLDVGIFALDGLSTVQKVFDSVKNETGKEVDANMIILTKTKKSLISRILRIKNPTDEIAESLKKYGKKIFLVPNDGNVYEAQVQGEPLSTFSPNSKASVAYKKIAEKIMEW